MKYVGWVMDDKDSKDIFKEIEGIGIEVIRVSIIEKVL